MEGTTETFNFELVSPEQKLMSEPAWQVTIPGEEGDFGVRAGHMALVASVKPGVVEVVAKQGDAPRKIFISGGFADVTAKNCTLLAETAVNVSDLKASEIEQDIRNFADDLNIAKDAIERARATQKLTLARAKLAAVSGKASV